MGKTGKRWNAAGRSILFCCCALLLSSGAWAKEEEYKLDLSEVEKKPYHLGGFAEARPVLNVVDKSAALYKTNFYNYSVGATTPEYNNRTPEAVQVMADRRLDLATHITQPLSDPLIRHADLIFTMTHGHRQAIVGHWPDAAGRTHVLCGEHVDVSDPIGGPRELYRRCAEQIEQGIRRRIDEFDLGQAVRPSIGVRRQETPP